MSQQVPKAQRGGTAKSSRAVAQSSNPLTLCDSDRWLISLNLVKRPSVAYFVAQQRKQGQPNEDCPCQKRLTVRILAMETKVLFQDSVPLSPTLAKVVGRTAAHLIQQVYFHLTKTKHFIDGIPWIYNNFEEWGKQLGVSAATIKRAVTKLRRMGVLLTERLSRHEWYQVNWYSLDLERLECLIFRIGSLCSHSSVQLELFLRLTMTRLLQTLYAVQLKTTDAPTHHPVYVSEEMNREGILEPPNERGKLLEEVAGAIAPAPLNPHLQALVLSASAQTVRNAIEVVRERQRRGKAKNPPGLLADAIKGGWTVSQVEKAAHDEGFNEWFDLARSLNLVSACARVDGEMCVYDSSGKGEMWGVMKNAFSLERLKAMVRDIGLILD